MVLHLTSPSDGARIERGIYMWESEGLRMSPLLDQPEGLRSGDLVIAVEGHSVEFWAEALFAFDEQAPRWAIGQTLTYTIMRDERRIELPVTLGRYPLSAILKQEWGAILSEMLMLLVAGFVFVKRPADRAARALFLASAGIMSASTWSFGLQVGDLVGRVGFWLYLLTTLAGYALLWIAALHFALVFPQPHPLISKRRWIIPALYVAPYVTLIAFMLNHRLTGASTFAWLGKANGGIGLIQLVYMLLAVAAIFSGYRATRDPAGRLKVRWIAFAFILVGSLSIAFGTLPEMAIGYPLLSWNVLALLGLLVPATVAIAILRHQLFDINLIISHALVYAGLTSMVVALYVLAVGYFGSLFRIDQSLFLSLAMTGVIAVIFQPLRERLQRTVNRLIYGERDDPYSVLSRLSHGLKDAMSPQDVMPMIVSTVAEALKLRYVSISLKDQMELKVASSFGLPVEDVLELPLVYQGKTIGALNVAPRGPGETFTREERRLLENIAHQAGVAAYTVRLTADLQRSRERLVTAREEERRRLRRDLHDKLGPELASMGLKLDAIRSQIRTDPNRAETSLGELKGQTRSAISGIRDLIQNLRPPALDELGLVSAVREGAVSQDAGGGLRILVETSDSLPPLPAAVEVAAYRIALEAVTNVARHAHARRCVIRFDLKDALELEVVDDGVGLPEQVLQGKGLTSMQERASELGGSCLIEALPGRGTRLRARLPLLSGVG
jgi:signal transduction histidine kinase